MEKIRGIMNKLEEMKKLFKLREKREEEYERVKEEFRKVLGKPSIHLIIEIPEGCEDMADEFLKLEKDEEFKSKIKKLVEENLKQKKIYSKSGN